jgi:hypothetical protein
MQFLYFFLLNLPFTGEVGARVMLCTTMGAKSIARRPPKVLNFEILELLTK